MMKKEWKAKQEIEDARGKTIELHYYLMEMSCSDGSLFGIAIEKVCAGKCEEAESLPGLSHVKGEALDILNRLIRGQVTPCTMREIIDEM